VVQETFRQRGPWIQADINQEKPHAIELNGWAFGRHPGCRLQAGQQFLSFVTSQRLRRVRRTQHFDLFQSSRSRARIGQNQFVDNVHSPIRPQERAGIEVERGGHQRRELLPGVVPIFAAPGLALLLTAMLLPLALPGMVLAGGLIVLSLKIITARWSTRLCLCFLASGTACIVLWFVVLVSSAPPELPGEIMVSTIELIWGGIFGLWLAVPRRVAAGRAA
jgi:hypothetical protein